MKSKVSDLVEKARFDSGMGTYPGDPIGHFLFHRGGSHLFVMSGAGDKDHWPFPGEPWDHVSVSLRDRCPTWEEMCWIRSLFFEDEETVIQFHPPKSQYINAHPYCLHLWRPTQTVLPLPPKGTLA